MCTQLDWWSVFGCGVLTGVVSLVLIVVILVFVFVQGLERGRQEKR